MADEDLPIIHPDVTPSDARERAVAEVLIEQDRRTTARRAPMDGPPTTTRTRLIVTGVAMLVAAWMWLASPGWLEPDPEPPIALEREEAGLRLAVFIQAQQVARFREERGRLPDALRETGEPLPGLRYERLDARTWRIHAVGDRTSVIYMSGDSLREFAGGVDRLLGITR